MHLPAQCSAFHPHNSHHPSVIRSLTLGLTCTATFVQERFYCS